MTCSPAQQLWLGMAWTRCICFMLPRFLMETSPINHHIECLLSWSEQTVVGMMSEETQKAFWGHVL